MMWPSLPGSWDDLVVMCAGTSWDGIWFPDKHIADRLAAYGPVLYVDTPMSPMTPRRQPQLADALEGPRLRLIRPSLARLTPVVLPGLHRPAIHLTTEYLTRRALRRAVAALGGSVRTVVQASPDVLFGACGERRRVVYATDDFVAGAALMGVPEARLRRLERRQLEAADLVIAASPTIAAKWEALGAKVVLIPNGCDHELFATTDDAPLPDDVNLPAPIAGFVGHLSDRIDLTLLEAVAERGCSLLLVGPRQGTFELSRMDRLLARTNVTWVGAKPFEALPSYARLMDVGLTPYGDTAFNRASFPLKTLEYLAGGRAVVATDLPVQRWLDTDLISVASGPNAFADAVEHALRQPRTAQLAASRRAFAASHSWAVRTSEFAAALGLTVPVGDPAEPGADPGVVSR